MVVLENEKLKVVIREAGAEVREIFHKEHQLQFMWSGDKNHWGRVAPVLFPIVGKLKDNSYEVDDHVYSMSQHGFLRDQNFSVEEATDKKAVFKCASQGRFKEKYPYEFEVYITYELKGVSLDVNWRVINKNQGNMYFSIGGHPAFNIPLLSGEILEDYFLEFTPSERAVERYYLDGTKNKEENLSRLNLEPHMFAKDALIFTNIDEISIKSNKNPYSIKLNFKDFPFVGVWTRYYDDNDSVAPFLCIEPWYGIADIGDNYGDFTKKVGINKLDQGESFDKTYSISIR